MSGVGGAVKQGFGWATGCLLFIIVAVIALAIIAGLGRGGAAVATPTSPQVAPTDQPSIAASATTSAAFAPISLKGHGDKVARFTIPADAAAIATITNSGGDNFTVESLDASGSTNELLVNVIGAYNGTRLFDIDAGTHSVAFKIGSTANWTAKIAPVSSARAWDGSSPLARRHFTGERGRLEPSAPGERKRVHVWRDRRARP